MASKRRLIKKTTKANKAGASRVRRVKKTTGASAKPKSQSDIPTAEPLPGEMEAEAEAAALEDMEGIEEVGEVETITMEAHEPGADDREGPPPPVDDVPGRPASRRARKSSGRPGSGSKGSTRRRTPGKRESGGTDKPSRQPGAEIGRMHRRGMSLAVKFSLCISALIILISFLFGLVVISIFRDKLKEEIVRSGYQQVLTLQAYGKRMYPDWISEGEWSTEQFQATEAYKNDLANMKKIVDGDDRVFDIAFFASRGEENPKGKVLIVGDGDAFTPPTNPIPNPEGADPDIEIWWGWYGQENKTRAMFFRAPVIGSGQRKQYTANLILSAAQIDSEVQNMMTKIGLFGLVFVGAGIALSLGLASAVTSPINVLVRDMDIVSRGDLDHETRSQTSDEIGLLATAFNRMTHSLKHARDQEREVERLNSELDLAQEVHAELLPKKMPNLPGFDIGTGYYCAKEVGGDYYDFIPVDKEHLAIVIADVSGKGVPGSITMSWTRIILRMMAPLNLSPADVLSKTNYHVARSIKRGMFVTCMYALINVPKREMIVGNAGHNPMIIWRDAERTCEMVRPNGIALGFDKGPIFDRTVREQKVKLNRGDRVLLYTDGIPESMNEDREEWGDDNLERFVEQYAHLSSKEFVRLMVSTLEQHQGNAEQHDDITITTWRID